MPMPFTGTWWTSGFEPFAESRQEATSLLPSFYYMAMGMDAPRNLERPLSKQFKVLVAGGFVSEGGKVFRIKMYGEADRYASCAKLSSINSVTSMLNAKTNIQPLGIAAEKLKVIQ